MIARREISELDHHRLMVNGVAVLGILLYRFIAFGLFTTCGWFDETCLPDQCLVRSTGLCILSLARISHSVSMLYPHTFGPASHNSSTLCILTVRLLILPDSLQSSKNAQAQSRIPGAFIKGGVFCHPLPRLDLSEVRPKK